MSRFLEKLGASLKNVRWLWRGMSQSERYGGQDLAAIAPGTSCTSMKRTKYSHPSPGTRTAVFTCELNSTLCSCRSTGT